MERKWKINAAQINGNGIVKDVPDMERSRESITLITSCKEFE